MTSSQHIYLIPGMFGFGQLAGYDYFGHVERALRERLQRAGGGLRLRVVPTPPTASLRRRARHIAQVIAEESVAADQIHLVGHSTGGLDARLLASPSVCFSLPPETLAWRRALRSVVTMNTPHYGTPLAQFFTTVSGTRLLYALSLLTVTTLKLGGRPLTVFANLMATAGRVDALFGMRLHVLASLTDLCLRYLGDEAQEGVRLWLDGISQDQGGIVQITPEGMDLFNATTENHPEVRYGCVLTSAPMPSPVRWLGTLPSPYGTFSATLFSTLYAITARAHKHYPYPSPSEAEEEGLRQGLGRELNERLNDGIVPTLSMLWGELLWCGLGDHLDIMGHFADDKRPALHTDWLLCGAGFDRRRFSQAMDAIAAFILREAR